MTALGQLIAQQIARTGPMTLADYIHTCLLHPDHGYYTIRDPLGAAGDFTTAPEISQMFGELIGLCLAQTWMDQGSPDTIQLAELGPGRGTLMADALRATARVPGFHAALRLHLIEASPTLRAEQNARLPLATWHSDLSTLPDGPLYLIANEFLDALPIRQFQREGSGWRERVVGLEGDTLKLGLTPPAPIASLEHRLGDTKDGNIVEVCPALPGMISQISTQIAEHGGMALIIDYGDWGSQGDTFQALSKHQTTDPLAAPGTADLTAHVDFAAIAQASAPATHTRLTPQGVFLERLGITQRAQALAAPLSGDALDSHIAAHRRLTHPEQMGQLFKVIGLVPNGAALPPGFAS